MFDRAALEKRVDSLKGVYYSNPAVALRMVGPHGSDRALSWVLVFHNVPSAHSQPANLPPDAAADLRTAPCDAVLILDAADGAQREIMQFCGPTKRGRAAIDAGKSKPVIGYGQS